MRTRDSVHTETMPGAYGRRREPVDSTVPAPPVQRTIYNAALTDEWAQRFIRGLEEKNP
jgi:hypothetical protein